MTYKNPDLIQALTGIGISGVAGAVRYLSELRKGTREYKLKSLLLEFTLACGVGLGSYGIVIEYFKIDNQLLISSVMFIVGLLYNELINLVVDKGPRLIESIVTLIIELKLGLVQQQYKNKVEELKKEQASSVTTSTTGDTTSK